MFLPVFFISMAFGYPPKVKKVITFKGSEEAFIMLAEKAFDNLNWRLVEESKFILRAETPHTWMSEKDIFTIMIHQQEATLESRYGGKGGGWDYGKNAKNIKDFLAELERLENSGMFV